ncbi:MAG: hypothetical protein DRH70_03215 [Candidatus Coatesbacteria bacterium]|nr:MAG: hypothetical protein DRH70_03215 [Candidatus Coatesbacteria bacterium]
MSPSALDVVFSKKFARLPSEMSPFADGSCVAVVFANGVVMLLDAGGEVLWEHTLEGRPASVGVTPEGQHIYVSTDRGLVIFDRSGNQLRRVKERVDNAVLSPDGRFAFLGVSDATKHTSSVSLYDATKKGLLKRHPGAVVWREKFDDAYQFFAGARDGSRVVLGFARRVVCMDAEQTLVFDHRTASSVKGLAVLPDMSRVFFSTFDGHVVGLGLDGRRVYSAEAGEEVGKIACDGKGDWIIAASRLKPMIFMFDRDGKLVWHFPVPSRPIHVWLSDDADSIAVCCGNDELLMCRNYFMQPEQRVQRALRLINERDYASLSLQVLARSSAESLTALVNAVKDGTVQESSYKLIGKLPEQTLSRVIGAMVLDDAPGQLFRCLATFYMRALPLVLQHVGNLDDGARQNFYGRLAVAAVRGKDARLFDLLGLIHLHRGELVPAVKRFFEAVSMENCPEPAMEHLREAREALEQAKATSEVDKLFTTFV